MISLLRAFTRLLAGLAVWALVGPGRAADPTLVLKDQDVWVMAGDSITGQRLHTNYLEAFFRTRFPQLRLHFRNEGLGGSRTSRLNQRFGSDVTPWKPTIVSVELGMNDVTGPLSNYINGSRQILDKIRALPAQPVLFSASPVNDGSITGDWKSSRCQKIDPYTVALGQLAAEQQVVFADQYHALLDLWGENLRRDNTEGTLPGGPAYIPLGGNPVHVGSVAQYTMAAALLQDLHVDGFVSSATLGADGQVLEATRCTITDVSTQGGKLSFTRLDECGPWPILPSARSAVQLYPAMLDLSRYLLCVNGLAEGDYRISINGQPAGILSSQTLATGWNLTNFFDGALGDRASAILALIGRLQGGLNNNWRAAIAANDPAKLAAAQAAITACETDLQKLVQPVPLRFSLEKVFTVPPVVSGTRPDAATATRGTTIVYPLANDLLPGTDTITAVSNPAVLIRGRSLVVPAGFTGTFTYTATNGTLTSTAPVAITAATPEPGPLKYNGLLLSASGAVVGSAQVGLTLTGTGVAQIRLGPTMTPGRFTLHPRDTTATGRSAYGAFTVTRTADGTLAFNLAAAAGPRTGTLRATRTVTPLKRYHVALASITASIPGGGFAIVTTNAAGAVHVGGRLPDGRAFTGGSSLNDNGSIAFYGTPSGSASTRGLLGGEFVLADLVDTDLTGELTWTKPPQPHGAKGLHLGGLATVLTANGSLYAGAIPLTGPGAILLSGGNLPAPETDPITAIAGTPAVPDGSVLAWTNVYSTTGTFVVRIRPPGVKIPVSGEGLYLPKSHRAWGLFPGTTEGGRLELTVPGE